MNQNEIKESYNKESKHWNSLMIQGDEITNVNKPFFDLLEKYHAITLLDVGCGSGLHSVQFAKMGYDVTGVDISTKMIDEAKKNSIGIKNIKFICEDMNQYKIDTKYDAIWACSSLHNMEYPIIVKSLNTIVNLLKEDNGVLSITMRKGTFEGVMTRNNVERYYRYSNPREIKALLKQYPLIWKATTYKTWFNIPYFTVYFLKTK